MRKRLLKNRYLRKGLLFLGILVLFTNCEKETYQGNLDSIAREDEVDLSDLYLVKINYENAKNSLNIDLNKTNEYSKKKKFEFLVDWEKSKVVKYKKDIKILYTPIYSKSNHKRKMFLGSVKEREEIISNYFTIYYGDNSTKEAFSGYIFRHNELEELVEMYYYESGKMQYRGLPKTTNKLGSKNVQNKESDCGELTLADIDWIVEAGGLDSLVNMLECVTVIGMLPSEDNDGGGTNNLNIELNLIPSFYLPAISYPTSGGGSISPTSNIPTEPSDYDWWQEDTNTIDIESIASTALLNSLTSVTLTSTQINWINNADFNTLMEIINFLDQNNSSLNSQGFVYECIDILSSPELPSDNNLSNYSTEILRMTNHLKQWGNPEDEFFADYIESLVPDFSSMTVGDVYDIYKLTRTQVHNLTGKYFKSVIVPFAEAAFPFVVYAVTEATLGVATSLISKIPLNMVSRGTRLNKMLTKLSKIGTPISGNEFFRKIPQSSVQKALKLFEKLTKDAIYPPTTNAQGTIVANMGNNTYITFRTVSDTPGVIATIDINASSLFSQIIKLKFYQ